MTAKGDISNLIGRIGLTVVTLAFSMPVLAVQRIDLIHTQDDFRLQVRSPLHYDRIYRQDYSDNALSNATTTLSWSHGFRKSTLATQSVFRLDQQYHGVSIGTDRFSIMGYSGSGDTIANIKGAVAGMDPFHFHGGISRDYQYRGAYADIGLTESLRLAGGVTRIQSSGLNDRSVYQLGLHTKKAGIAFMPVFSQGERSGDAWILGMAAGKSGRIEAQYLEHSNGAHYAGVAYSRRLSPQSSIRIALVNRRNRLADMHNEDKVVFSYSFVLGNSRSRLHATEAPAEDTPVPQEGPHDDPSPFSVMVAVSAVAVGVGLSSGGGGGGEGASESSPRLVAQHNAARNILNEINPVSVAQNREFGGYVLRNADGTFSTTTPIRGDASSVALPNPASQAPAGGATVASYHTHAGPDPRFLNEQFSAADLAGDRFFNIDGYLGTPGGKFLYHDVDRNAIQNLGTIAN
ncbi:MAG: DUF4329 domain-containing protein [Pseudomonadota bacterium]